MSRIDEIEKKARAEFAEELRKYWSFDDEQQHTHSWHDRENFIDKKLRDLLLEYTASLSNR